MTFKEIKEQLDIITIDKWEDNPDIPEHILTMPNIPKPLQGEGCQPRTIFKKAKWDEMRKRCYTKAKYTCEVCGYKPDNTRNYHAHELYDIDYTNQTATFKRCVGLCYFTHILAIHTGRALTLYKKGNPMFTKEKLLDGAKHAFTIISAYNKAHPEGEPLRLFSAWVDYMRQDELRDEMWKMIQEYDIKFYKIAGKWENKKNWGNWQLIIKGKHYKTPYVDRDAWESAMEKNNTKLYGTPKGRGRVPFKGEVYDKIDEILAENTIDK